MLTGARALVIDQNHQPLDIISWQKAMTVLSKGDAILLRDDENVKIRTIREVYNMPSVIMYPRSIRMGKQKISFKRGTVFWRDGFRCQYCGFKPTVDQIEDLTFDHVIPRCQGGVTSWTNVVTACQDCNSQKAGRTPEQAGMKLKKQPVKPSWVPPIMFKTDGVGIHPLWMDYWDSILKP